VEGDEGLWHALDSTCRLFESVHTADEIEVRGFADGRAGVDEVVHRIDGRCTFHLEGMNGSSYWFARDLPDGRPGCRRG
jgi:hypothetical protein